MGMKKINKAIAAYAEKRYHFGYDEGYDSGYSQGYSEGYEDASDSFNDGVKAERKRIIDLFLMLSEQQLENGSGTKAKLYREVVDLIKIADMNFDEVEDDETYGL